MADRVDAEALITEARKVATKGVQINDGHTYSVHAHDLVEYSETIMALIEELRQERERSEVDLGDMLDERDHWQDRLDVVIYSLATIEEVGEWSSANDPDIELVDVVQGRVQFLEAELARAQERAGSAEHWAESMQAQKFDLDDKLTRAREAIDKVRALAMEFEYVADEDLHMALATYDQTKES